MTDQVTPPKTFWVISILGLLWNAVGIVTYLSSVTLTPEALAEMPEAERALYTDIPVWVTSAYAIAVFGGTMACLVLLMRRAWATWVFLISLVAILIQMGHALLITPLLDVQGPGAAVLPLVIIVVAIALLWYAWRSRKKGWLH